MFLIFYFLVLAYAQFLPSPSGLTAKLGAAGVTIRFKEVPAGTCELTAGVKSYSGYADIPGTNQSIFFWMFEARSVDPATAPMTIRLDGGPGASSMNGLFQEVGPCTIDKSGAVVNNPYAWNNASNMLFVDQPTQVGFSYSEPVPGYIDPQTGAIQALKTNKCPGDPIKLKCGTYSLPDLTLTANTTGAATPTFWKTLQGFMGAFPQYNSANNTVHIATESYGGHYGPIFATYIQSQNALVAAKTPGLETAIPINLKTLIIGNGFYDATTQFPAYYNYTVNPGNTYDLKPFNATQAAQLYNNVYGKGGCLERNMACVTGPGSNGPGNNAVCADAENFCEDNVESFFDTNVGRDEDDIREIALDPFPPTYYYNYLNTPTLQAAIGATTNWTAASGTIFIAFNSTGDVNRDGRSVIIPAIAKLLQQGITVALSAGDADYDSNWIGGEAVAKLVAAPGFESAGYANLTTSDGRVHGQVKQAGGFSFTRIYEAGHEAPFYQPLATYEMFMRAITATDIQTGQIKVAAGASTYASIGTVTSTFREGNSSIRGSVTVPDSVFNVTSGMPVSMAKMMMMRTRALSRRALKAKFLGSA